MRNVTPLRHRRRLRAGFLVAALLCGVFGATPPAQAATAVGPCTGATDIPHASTSERTGLRVMRSHSKYYCLPNSALYFRAETTVYFCTAEGQPVATCKALAADAGGDQMPNLQQPPEYKIITTADVQDPDSGYYVAQAVYEVCVFNGGAYPGTETTGYSYYDSRSKVSTVLKDVSGG